MTDLQDTIKAHVGQTMIFTLNGEDHPVSIDDMSEAALIGLLMYGRRKANDTFNSAKGGESPISPEAVVDKIRSWDFNYSGGFSRVSPVVKAQRDVVDSMLRSIGYKAAEARKLAKDPLSGFTLYVADMTELEGDELEDKVQSNWDKVTLKAAAIVEASKVAQDILD